MLLRLEGSSDEDRFVAAGGEVRETGPHRCVLPNVEELATVVVCEDDDPTRELLCDHLTADRYRALPAPSASDALRLCGYNQPDLMVLDLGLPDAPGIDVLREIRRSGERFDPDLPVLILSGRSSEADRLRGFEAGADDFVLKPTHGKRHFSR
jgi:DNA-binding response OmpR family regulator